MKAQYDENKAMHERLDMLEARLLARIARPRPRRGLSSMRAEQLNELAAEADRLIDACLRGRSLPPSLRGTLFLCVEQRLRDGQRPALARVHELAIDAFAKHPRWIRSKTA